MSRVLNIEGAALDVQERKLTIEVAARDYGVTVDEISERLAEMHDSANKMKELTEEADDEGTNIR